MSSVQNQIQGKITFIHHDKNRAIIEYIDNGKKKTIQAETDFLTQQKLKEQKLIKKIHRFLVGDHVSFTIKKTGSNGSKIYAANLQYQYNTALELLINKASTENKFIGYIKITDGQYFIKEIESYLFFPLTVSPYEIAPAENETTSPVFFRLENIDNPEKVTSVLFNHNYIPEFLIAVQHFKKQTAIDAIVYKVTPFSIHVKLAGKMEAKLGIEKINNDPVKINDVIAVKIKHLSPTKIVIERAG